MSPRSIAILRHAPSAPSAPSVSLRRFGALVTLAVAAGALSLAACDGDGDTATEASGTATYDKPLYGISSLRFTDQGTQSTFIALLGSLDTQQTVRLASTREFPGYAASDVYGGKLFMSDGERPKLTRFAISDQRGWTEETSAGFGAYGSSSLTSSIYASATRAYAPSDATGFVAWSPSDLKIGGPLAAAAVPPKRGDFDVKRGYAGIVAGKYAYQPFYFSDPTYARFSETSTIVAIDTTTDATVAFDAPAPHLHIATKDDGGDVYFSNGQYSIAGAVIGTSPENGIVRVRSGETAVDPTFKKTFRELTSGHEGGNFFYVGGGKGVFSAYHEDRDPAEAKDATKIGVSSNYHLWTLDLATLTAKPTEGIDYTGGQLVAFTIDGRTFAALPAGDFTTTTIYELTADGRAEKRFDVEGWAFLMFRVR